jgi:hypothetical protein
MRVVEAVVSVYLTPVLLDIESDNSPICFVTLSYNLLENNTDKIDYYCGYNDEGQLGLGHLN